jgi:hypothetical protein
MDRQLLDTGIGLVWIDTDHPCHARLVAEAPVSIQTA